MDLGRGLLVGLFLVEHQGVVVAVQLAIDGIGALCEREQVRCDECEWKVENGKTISQQANNQLIPKQRTHSTNYIKTSSLSHTHLLLARGKLLVAFMARIAVDVVRVADGLHAARLVGVAWKDKMEIIV